MIDRVPLRDLALTRLALGCAPIGGLFEAVGEDQARATVGAAWAAGVRTFDTAPLYGYGTLRAPPRSRPRRIPARRARDLDQGGATARGARRRSGGGGRDLAGGARPACGLRLQRRRRPALARSEPGTARARSHRRGGSSTTPTTISSRRCARPRRGARATARRGPHRRVRGGHEPGPGAHPLRAGDRRRLRHGGRPVHPARPVGGRRAAAHLPRTEGGRARRGGLQQRGARHPGARSDVRLRQGAGDDRRACGAHRRRVRALRPADRGGGDGLPRAPSRGALRRGRGALARGDGRRCRAVRWAAPRGALGRARRRGTDSAH